MTVIHNLSNTNDPDSLQYFLAIFYLRWHLQFFSQMNYLQKTVCSLSWNCRFIFRQDGNRGAMTDVKENSTSQHEDDPHLDTAVLAHQLSLCCFLLSHFHFCFLFYFDSPCTSCSPVWSPDHPGFLISTALHVHSSCALIQRLHPSEASCLTVLWLVPFWRFSFTPTESCSTM